MTTSLLTYKTILLLARQQIQKQILNQLLPKDLLHDFITTNGGLNLQDSQKSLLGQAARCLLGTIYQFDL